VDEEKALADKAAESVLNRLEQRGESKAGRVLKRYREDPLLEQAWAYALDYMTSSKERRGLVST